MLDAGCWMESAPPERSAVDDQLTGGAHLDGPETRARDLRGQVDGLVQVPRLEQVESRDHLLRLGEGAVGDGRLPAADAHARGRARGLEGLRYDEVTARPEAVIEVEVRRVQDAHIARGHRVQLALVQVDQA